MSTQLLDTLRLREAVETDLAAINDIYNYYVLHSTATYQTEPSTLDERRAWFEQHGPKHPVTVLESGGAVVGWASLSPFHRRAAYGNTVENSVYIRHGLLGRGLGSRLLADLIDRANAIGHRTIIGLIDADQKASIALHAKFGFVQAAHLREVGFKFGRWLDVVYMQRILPPLPPGEGWGEGERRGG